MKKQTTMQDFKVLKKIGQGAFGKVYKVKRISDDQYYAIKVINVSQMDRDSVQNTLNEVRILSSIEHNNIVCYKEAFMERQGREMNIVMEYVTGGDVDNIIQQYKKKKQYLKEDLIWNFLCQIFMGLKKLHDMKVIHRDIKAGNLFVSKDHKIIKLGDLNVAKVAKNNLASTQVGTPYYLAPEIWENELYDYKCDIFSLGVTMYELICLKLPFEGKSIQQIYKKIKRGIYKNIPSHFSIELQQIIKDMLIVNPKNRPNIDQLINNKFIQDKMYQYGYNDIIQEQKNLDSLIQTILVPRNLKNLNKKLPQQKKYQKRSSSVKNNTNTNQIQHLINKVQKKNDNLPPIKYIQNSNQNLPPIKQQKKRRQSPHVKRYRQYLQKLNEQSKQRKINIRRGNSVDIYQQKKIRF